MVPRPLCVACVFTIFLIWATYQWHSSKLYYPNDPKLHLLQKVRVKLMIDVTVISMLKEKGENREIHSVREVIFEF